MTRRLLLTLAALLGLVAPAGAQTYRESQPKLLTSTDDRVSLDTKGMGTATVSITGTFTGTVSFYVEDAFGGRKAVNCNAPDSSTSVTTATAVGSFGSCNVAGWPTFSAVFSTPTSGSPRVVLGAAATGGGGGGSLGEITLGDVTVGDVGITSIAAGDTNIGNVDLASAIPAGNNNIGDIDIASIAAGNNNIGDVDVASSALPTGASTSALQTTGNSSLSSIDGKITAVNTGAVVIASGTVTAVTAITNALPAGTNAIGKLAANSGVDIGDVDVTSSALPTGASTSAKQDTEITALQLIDNPVGSASGGTAGTSSFLAGGQYNSGGITLTNTQQAALQVNSAGALLVSGAAGGTSASDNSAFTTGTTSLTPGGGLYDSTPDSLTDGRTGVFALTIKRALHTSLYDTTGTSAFGTAGSSATPVLSVQGIASGTALPVSVATIPSHAVTNAGTFAVQESGAALTALQLIDNLPNTIGSTTSGQYGALVQGAVTTAAPTYSNTQTHPLSLTTAGSLRVDVMNGAAGGTALADNGTFTTSSTNMTPAGGFYEASPTTCTTGKACAIGLTTNREQKVALYAGGTALTQDTGGTHDTTLGTITSITGGVWGGYANSSAPTNVTAGDWTVGWFDLAGRTHVTGDASMAQLLVGDGSGSFNTIVDSGTITTVSTVTNLAQMGGAAITMGAGGTGTGVQRVIEANDSQLSAGVGATGDAAATAGSTGSVTAKLRLLTTQMDTNNTALAAIQTAVQLIDNDQTGWSKHAVTSTASTNDTVVSASAGRLSSIALINTTATLYYLRLYDIASGDATCSSATGFFVSLPVPASTTGAGLAVSFPNGGIAFSSGIGYCITGGSTSTDNTNAAAGIFGVIAYK